VADGTAFEKRQSEKIRRFKSHSLRSIQLTDKLRWLASGLELSSYWLVTNGYLVLGIVLNIASVVLSTPFYLRVNTWDGVFVNLVFFVISLVTLSKQL
jgi:hypothetical protein